MKRTSARAVGAMALITVAALGVAAIAVRWGSNLSSSRFGPLRPGATGAHDPDQQRRIARTELIRSGELAAAVLEYQRLDASELDREDWLQIGEHLRSQKKPLVLTWAAFEAARRMDPRHPATLALLEELQNRMGEAQGQERFQIREASRRLEYMGEISGGPALGTFILGMARFASTDEQVEELLDRLMLRDRVVLRSVDSPRSAWKLVARLLLESGRAVEARDLLKPLLQATPAGSDATLAAPLSPSSSASDPEIAWLLSRAGLQLDDQEQADLMLEQSQGFGLRDSHTPEPSPYVGARKCGECHRRLYREQQHESRHALTIYRGPELKNVPLPSGALTDPENPHVSHTLERVAADQIRLETNAEGKIYRTVIGYALGSGHHGITMVGKDENDTYRELRVSYFSNGPVWDRTKGMLPSPRNPSDYIGKELSPRAFRDCIACHTTRFLMPAGRERATVDPESLDRGIGCERCHGPGLHHVKAMESGFAESAIAQRADTAPAWRLQLCAACHGSDGSISPQDPEFVRVQGTTLTFSRCFKESSGRLDCIVCHDPHTVLETSPAYYEARCLECHGDTRSSGNKTARDASVCPVNPSTGCIGCHMPSVPNAAPHTSFTDHHIRIHREQAALTPPAR